MHLDCKCDMKMCFIQINEIWKNINEITCIFLVSPVFTCKNVRNDISLIKTTFIL